MQLAFNTYTLRSIMSVKKSIFSTKLVQKLLLSTQMKQYNHQVHSKGKLKLPIGIFPKFLFKCNNFFPCVRRICHSVHGRILCNRYGQAAGTRSQPSRQEIKSNADTEQHSLASPGTRNGRGREEGLLCWWMCTDAFGAPDSQTLKTLSRGATMMWMCERNFGTRNKSWELKKSSKR